VEETLAKEARNPKEARNSKLEVSKRSCGRAGRLPAFWSFEPSVFEFVSNFVLRISDFFFFFLWTRNSLEACFKKRTWDQDDS